VNLGNNHIGNFGRTGITQTQDRLTTDQIRYFGNVGSNTTNRFTVFTIKGLRIGLVNYNQFVSGGLVATLADLEEIQSLADVVIVYTHWGEEYQTTASPAVQKLARQFIDQGADVVIGSHPHVTQPEEMYQGKKIFYSLGNFVFDQYFQPETQRGLLAEVTIDPQSLDISTKSIPIRLQPNGQTRVE
jgi:poly-gamma-glutamate synthesis protein (capsule biosynthesis protein)